MREESKKVEKKVKSQLYKLKHILLSETHAYILEGMNTGILSYDWMVCTRNLSLLCVTFVLFFFYYKTCTNTAYKE